MMRYNRNYILTLLFSLLIFDTYADEPKVCFFMDDNYNGESLCAGQGNAVSNIPERWNDRISSISIPHGLVVSVYDDINYSGRSYTFETDVDLFSEKEWENFNDQISSFKVNKAVCFYGDVGFVGDSICLSNGERYDLYNNSNAKRKLSHFKDPLNDEVYSIKIPDGMQATIYEDDNYNGKNFTLTENYTFQNIMAIGMDKKISSVYISENNDFICDRYCPINTSIHLNIKNSFGSYWHDPRVAYKDMLLDFNRFGNEDFLIKFSDNSLIRVKDNQLLLINGNNNEGFSFALNPISEHLSFLLRFQDGLLQMQFIESSNNDAVYYSPIFYILSDYNQENVSFDISNNNKLSPIMIDKIVLLVGKEPHRFERSSLGISACWLIPLLSIYNYVIQGKCNQVDQFVHVAADFFGGTAEKKLQVFGSSLPLEKKSSNETLDDEFSLFFIMSDVRGYLTYVTTNMTQYGLTIPATALACKTSMRESILPHMRHRRDLTPGCIDWTLDILTDFTLLFGGSIEYWNSEHFGHVIANIVREGTIGYLVVDADAGARLIENVQTHITANANITDVIHLKTAFNFSQLNYAAYLRHTDEVVVRSPQAAQELPLGRYELSLAGYQFTETMPRIRQDGRWVGQENQSFDIQIIAGAPVETEVDRRLILPTIEEWRQIYGQQEVRFHSLQASEQSELAQNEMAPLLEAARLTSEVAASWLRTSREDYVYVVVRLAGNIVSVTMAVDINEYDVGIAGSLTNPQFVLTPDAEGSIRGAGTAAIRALAEYYKGKGKLSLVSSVISQPSAIVKQKVGFKFVGDL